MLLSRSEIKKYVARKQIVVKPWNENNLGPVSLDLTLGNEFGVLKPGKIVLSNDVDYKKYVKTFKVKNNESISLKPGAFMLGITKEHLKLPSNIAGLLSARSRFARFGLLIHATAPLVQPGTDGKQILEVRNISKNELIIKPGLKIAQIAFIKLEGRATYNGVFKKQESIA